MTWAHIPCDERTGRTFVVNYGDGVCERAPWWAHDVRRLRHWLQWLRQPVSVVHAAPGSVSVIDTVLV